MYGQKQILQCLAVALVLAVFNFHRTAIKRNREIKPRIRSKCRLPAKLKPEFSAHIDNQLSTYYDDSNFTGYCIRYPFGTNVNGLHEPDVWCSHVCFDNFNTWIQKKCQANCCFKKRSAYDVFPPQKPRNGIDNGASLQNKHHETVKTIRKPINEKLMSKRLIRDLRYEIETADEFICKNTTSITVDFVKLEINQTEHIMDYHGFLFGMDTPSNPKPTRHPGDSRKCAISCKILNRL